MPKKTKSSKIKKVSQKMKGGSLPFSSMPLQGEGFLGDAWDWTKKKVGQANQYLKKNKIVSSTLNDLGYSNAARVAGHFGYGRVRGCGLLL